MRRTLSLMMAMTALLGPGAAQGQTGWTRANEVAYDHSRMAEAGFAPIDDITAGVVEVRRLLLHSPYNDPMPPAIELQKRADGGIFLKVQGPGWSTTPVAVDPGLWSKLIAMESAVFASLTPAARSAPPPLCHGWTGLIVAGPTRTAQWRACAEETAPRRLYVNRMIAAALATRPHCRTSEDEPGWALEYCFGDRSPFEDPSVGAQVAAARTAWAARPGPDVRMEARQALQQPMTLGDPNWLGARQALDAAGQSLASRRAQLAILERLVRAPPGTLPQADEGRLRNLMRRWGDYIASQEAEYGKLLKQLVDAPVAAGPGMAGR